MASGIPVLMWPFGPIQKWHEGCALCSDDLLQKPFNLDTKRTQWLQTLGHYFAYF